MMSLGWKAFESMGRQVKRARTLDMRPWLNAKYPNAGNQIRSRLGIGTRTRTQTRTRTRTSGPSSRGMPVGENGYIFKRRYKPLSYRRRRRFRRRLCGSYDKAILRDVANVSRPTRVGTSNVVWFQDATVLDPDKYILSLTGPATALSNLSRIFYNKIGTSIELYNPGSFNLNYRLIWGTVDELASSVQLATYGTATPPQINPYMGSHDYNTIWDSIRGTTNGKVPAGSRQKFNIYCSLGSRRIESTETSRKSKYTAYHLVYWPDLVVSGTTTPVIAYPTLAEETPIIFEQPFYHIMYPPSLNLVNLQTVKTSITGVTTPVATWITKNEDEMVTQA